MSWNWTHLYKGTEHLTKLTVANKKLRLFIIKTYGSSSTINSEQLSHRVAGIVCEPDQRTTRVPNLRDV